MAAKKVLDRVGIPEAPGPAPPVRLNVRPLDLEEFMRSELAECKPFGRPMFWTVKGASGRAIPLHEPSGALGGFCIRADFQLTSLMRRPSEGPEYIEWSRKLVAAQAISLKYLIEGNEDLFMHVANTTGRSTHDAEVRMRRDRGNTT